MCRLLLFSVALCAAAPAAAGTSDVGCGAAAGCDVAEAWPTLEARSLDAGLCEGDLCCSLNGVQLPDGQCECTRPWGGPRCETLLFKPVKAIQGYGMAPNLTSWGGNAIFDGTRYHLYVSTMTNGCLLSTWRKNSRIDYATSTDITGPYTFVDVAVNTWSHNAAPITLPDGTLAIFHIGDGSGSADGGDNCTAGEGAGEPVPRDPAAAKGASIHVSASPWGPWKPLATSTLGPCNNPSPWVHKNGTIFIVCNHNTLRRADNISGPWTTIRALPTGGGPPGNYEDPYLYIDANGYFHLLYHVYVPQPAYSCKNATVSAHLFSKDGHRWYASKVQPYTTQVALETGETVVVSTRERPKLFFSSPGKMTHLFNGVSSAASCPPPAGPKSGCVDCKYTSWDYTLVAPLDVDTREEPVLV